MRFAVVIWLLWPWPNGDNADSESRCDPPARWVCEGKKCRCVASAVSAVSVVTP